ncbi:hypothetical protein, partial [Klebsiella pneumoniae]|uniref:hypothetical protein n=1 Tax=Klebsiella pneumoniae TaxID=573 RepID=UPI001E378508
MVNKFWPHNLTVPETVARPFLFSSSTSPLHADAAVHGLRQQKRFFQDLHNMHAQILQREGISLRVTKPLIVTEKEKPPSP